MEVKINLLDAIPYLRAYNGQTFVIKAGGDLLMNPVWRDGLARDLTAMHRLGIRVVLVHGGGPQLDAAAHEAGVPIIRVAGRRVTDAATLDIATRVCGDQLARDWVEALGRAGEKAVALGDIEGEHIRARRRPPVLVTDDDGATAMVDFGFVGDIESVDPTGVNSVLDADSIPVISPLATTAQGDNLNVNADTVAAEVAKALGAAKLILMTRTPGILSDPDDELSALHWTDLDELASLESRGRLSGGMRPKVAAIRAALLGGIPRVHVVDGRRPGALLEEVFTTQGSGTLVVRQADTAPPEHVALSQHNHSVYARQG
jgi:acetylglutamate kinase